MRATAKDLRLKTREILAAVERGEEVIVTYRGKEKARIVPMAATTSQKEGTEESLFGMWRTNDRVADVEAFMDDIRGGRFHAR
jgi:prevent-host-death family protein